MSSTKAYKVGIGVTTFNRPAMLEKCLAHIHKYSGSHQLYVAVDKDDDRQGVAKRKNECLRALKDCDYIFLFDDDCYPIAKGWEQFFIDGCKYGYTHFLFLNDKLHNKIGRYNNRDYYRDCGGVFMFLTKKDIERVGAFNEEFEIYGFEHAEYTRRITGRTDYPMLVGTEKYLYAHDYSDPLHKSSISMEERNKYVKKNWDLFFNNTIKSIYLPL